MNTGPATPVDVTALALGQQLGQGGQGSVHQVLNKRINEGAAEGGWEVVYKEYSSTVLPQLDATALTAVADLLGRLTGAEGRWLCERTAWPAAVVQRQGQACGFLMRAVPDRFHFTLQTLTSANTGSRRLATMEYLLNDDAYVAGIGLAVSDRHRLLLLADLAATLDRLHRLGVTVGDVSPKNLLFALTPQPACFLIDCDAIRLHGATVLPQAETPDWHIPAGEERATRASDVYKLALLAVRIFARHQTATDPAALTAISPALADLARASLDPDPARRPAPAVWAEQLASAAIGASTSTTSKTPQNTRRPPARPGATGRPATITGTPKPPTSAAAKAGKILGTLAAALVLLLVIVSNQHSPQADASGTTDSGQTTSASTPNPTYSPPWTPAPDPVETTPAPETPTPTPPPVPTPTPTPTPTDPIATAQVGDCFYDTGTSGHADLTAANCTPGAFKVVQVNDSSTDLDSCDSVADSDESVSSTLYDRVLCLSYQSSGGTSYHAHQGDCVFGASGESTWSTQSCQSGNFKVLAVYRGTSDHTKCDNWPHYNYWRHMPTAGHAALDVLLCLSMNYPDDAGYATVNECLLKSGSTFTNVGSCAGSNVSVTGRTSTYDDPAFCGTSGSTSWRSNDYPAFGYTVCWHWL